MGIINDASSFGASIVRLGRGLVPRVTAVVRPDPKKRLELYDYEGCPYCRKVREVLCELDLDYVSHPVARGGRRRGALQRLGGKMQVPYLVDPNTGAGLYESDDIIDYLNRRYGEGRRAGWRIPIPRLLDDLDSGIASAVRAARGTRCRPGLPERNAEPLVLYNMEGSPYCRKVREALTELDLDFVVRNVPKGTPKRDDLAKRGGKAQVPYLIDPNTGDEMYESDGIVAHLERTYGPGTRAARRSPARKKRARKS
jgi:glutathione S-transferase